MQRRFCIPIAVWTYIGSGVSGMWDDLSISEDTKQMLNKLIEHHHKKEAYLKRSRIFIICLGLFSLSFVFHFYYRVLAPSNQRIDRILDHLFSDSLTFFLLVGTVTLFLTVNYHISKYQSTKQKLDKLRAEAIERINSPWVVSNKSKIKDQISIRMKRCGVNLSHKEK